VKEKGKGQDLTGGIRPVERIEKGRSHEKEKGEKLKGGPPEDALPNHRRAEKGKLGSGPCG